MLRKTLDSLKFSLNYADASMRPQRNAAENVGYNMQNYLFEMLQ